MQKAPLEVSDVWAIHVRLQITHRIRELALFNLAIDSKLRACDLVKLKVRDICHGTQLLHRANRDTAENPSTRSIRDYLVDATGR